ncbi:MAG: 16S rRNA processing protein RimM [Acidobacteria bacterium]|jgi:16S rRNA processing protein RimM|nr:16S rRNA processing protein RimM [Acidobacteriota bacterium]
MEDLVAIAKLVKVRGLRGEIVADVLTGFPERFEKLTRVFAISDGEKISELEIEKFWFQKNRVVLKFKNFDTIETAETLRGCEICVAETEAVELEADEFFDWELEGCAIETLEGEMLGTVKQLLRTGGAEILVVEGADKEYLIPFAKAICTEVDVENKRIKVDVPEGLLEF